MQEKTIKVVELIRNTYCVASADGDQLFQLLDRAVREGVKVTLSFAGAEVLTSAFLNSAIGQLYGYYKAEQIENLIEFADVDPDDLELINLVQTNAVEYFLKPEVLERIRREVLEDEE